MGNFKQAMRLSEEGGVRYANPLNDAKYKVRYHDIPAADDLEACMRLLESFERRFLHTVAGGGEWISHARDMDAAVEQRRAQFEQADEKHKQVAGSALCLSLLERGLTRAKEHIQRRIDGAPADDETLAALRKQAEKDLMEGSDYFDYLRRKRGHPDEDGVLAEMRGEPYKIFVGTLPGAEGVLEHFHHSRLLKAAAAMRCIDSVIDGAQKLAASHPAFAQVDVPQKLEALREAGKLRVQLPVSDPDFKETQLAMVVANTALHDVKFPESLKPLAHLPPSHPDRRAPSQTALAMIKEAADLTYDMAMVRNERRASVNNFLERVSEQLPPVQRRVHRA